MSSDPRAARLVVISGPSGVGKGTVVARLRERLPDIEVSVSATTRPRRRGEVDGVHYHFLDDERFDALVATDGLLEWATFAGNRYGTPAAPVREALARGVTVVLEIDVQGARQVKQRNPGALLVFLVPPSAEALERRLEERGTDGPEAVAARLALAEQELEAAGEFDAVVVNDDLETAVGEVVRILESQRL